MLVEVKRYLNIAWDDEEIDQKLLAIIEDSKEELCQLTDANLDFTKGLARELLMNRVRYAYNQALEFFEENFSREIMRLQLFKGVEKLEH